MAMNKMSNVLGNGAGKGSENVLRSVAGELFRHGCVHAKRKMSHGCAHAKRKMSHRSLVETCLIVKVLSKYEWDYDGRGR